MSDNLRDRRPKHYWVEKKLIDLYGPRMGVYGIAVYSILAYHADNDTDESFPGVERIAKMLSCSGNQVRKTLHDLQGLGVIDITPRFDKDGKRTSNVYTLHSVEGHPTRRGGELDSVERSKRTGLTPLANGGLEY